MRLRCADRFIVTGVLLGWHNCRTLQSPACHNTNCATCQINILVSGIPQSRIPLAVVGRRKQTSGHTKARCPPTTGRARNPIASAPLTVSYKSPNGPTNSANQTKSPPSALCGDIPLFCPSDTQFLTAPMSKSRTAVLVTHAAVKSCQSGPRRQQTK